MRGSKICKLIQNDKLINRVFRGVFAVDKLYLKGEGFYIVNISKSDSKGSHWTAFWVNGNGIVEFFDSVGNHPSFYNMGECDHFSKIVVQGDKPFCGYYCLLYGILKCRGFSLIDILEKMERVSDSDVAFWTLKHFWVNGKLLN